MHSSNKWLAVGFVLVSIVSGCNTVGDNELLFVTDTKVALDISGDPTGQPSFTLGYKRREAILLPLSSGTWGKPTHLCIKFAGSLKCEAVADDPARGSHVCMESQDASQANATSDNKKLLCDTADNVRGNLYTASVDSNSAKDSYSVMASFGLDSSGGGAKVAQFIATGIAAQNLTKKEISPLINPHATANYESVNKIVTRQISNIDKIAKNVVEDGKVDEAKLKALLSKSTLEQSSKDKILSSSGKAESDLKKLLSEDFQSNLEELANLVTEA